MNRFIIAALIPFTAAPAFAGNLEPVLSEPAPAPVVIETTPTYSFSGAYIGAQANYTDVSTDGAANLDDDGGLYGLRAGYDLQSGNLVYGGLIQYDTGSVELEASGIEVEDVLRLGGRLGYAQGPGLVYGLAGYADASTNVAGDADGYFLGAGYERFVTDNVTVGAEAIYHDLGELDGAAGTDVKATTVGLNLNVRF